MFGFITRAKEAARSVPHTSAEDRSLENPATPMSLENLVSAIGWGSTSASGIAVTPESALTLPAVWCAVHFLADTMASLPLKVYRKQADGRLVPSTRPIARLLSGAVNPNTTSYDWRKTSFLNQFLYGRQLTFVERAPSGVVLNLWPMDPVSTTVERVNGHIEYVYREGSRTQRYTSDEVIDTAYSMRPDGLTSRSPIHSGRHAIGLGLAIQDYAANFFNNGGVPPFVLTGPFATRQGLRRAAEDLTQAVIDAAKAKRQALVLPSGHTLAPIGQGPEDMQLVEAQRFTIEQVARIYSVPPTFLQDLTHGTLANVEHQDLQLVKHTITRLATQHEQQMGLTIFGRNNVKDVVAYDLDGLQRGDFKSRIEASARAVQTGIFTPNEARGRESLPPLDGGDQLFVQGAMLPMTKAGEDRPLPVPPADEDKVNDQ